MSEIEKRTPPTTTSRRRSTLSVSAGAADENRSGADSTWLTPHEAAAYLHVGVDIIYDACAVRGLRHTKLGHRTIRIRREWVDEWAEQTATAFR